VLPFWADDATILAPGTSPIVGKEAVRKYVTEAFVTPGFSITWKTEKVEVSQSGDMAYSTGTDWISFNGPDGKSLTEENRSVAIWKKQADGSWRCIVDAMSPAESSRGK
jgi:ketosteroid isomerase-like protein